MISKKGLVASIPKRLPFRTEEATRDLTAPAVVDDAGAAAAAALAGGVGAGAVLEIRIHCAFQHVSLSALRGVGNPGQPLVRYHLHRVGGAGSP
jgi:hypothetical protein